MFGYIFYPYAARQMSGALCCMCLPSDLSGRGRNRGFGKFAFVCSASFSWVQPFSTSGATSWGRTRALLSLRCHPACTIPNDLLLATFSLLFHSCSRLSRAGLIPWGCWSPAARAEAGGSGGLLHPCSGVWCPKVVEGRESGRLCLAGLCELTGASLDFPAGLHIYTPLAGQETEPKCRQPRKLCNQHCSL